MAAISWDTAEGNSSIALALAAIAERLRLSTVQVVCHPSSRGSGVIWHSDGLIITNAHVATSERVTVELSDGRAFEAVRTKIDPRRDLAALHVEATNLPAATLGDSQALRVGELVLAVGNPLGLTGALTTGIIHAKGKSEEREVRSEELKANTFHPSPITHHPSPITHSWVIADIRLAPGNSGGILANALGQVIGINTMIAGGLALAVPSNAVTQFLQESTPRPYLGVTMRPVLVRLGNRHILGLLILDVAFGSLAAAAGLIEGDVLISILGQSFQTLDDLTSVLWNAEPGDILPLEFLRAGTLHTCRVTVNRGMFAGVKSP